jgi:hypothetical protein
MITKAITAIFKKACMRTRGLEKYVNPLAITKAITGSILGLLRDKQVHSTGTQPAEDTTASDFRNSNTYSIIAILLLTISTNPIASSTLLTHVSDKLFFEFEMLSFEAVINLEMAPTSYNCKVARTIN